MHDYLIATYADGYSHDQLALNDVSPYTEGKNTFYDILNKLPEPEHGKLVKLTLVKNGHHFDIDWTKLPDNARPIRYREMEAIITQNAVTGEELDKKFNVKKLVFGYQYNDADGKNHQEVQVIN